MGVMLIDRAGTVASGGASQACAGGVRHQGRAPVEMPLAIHALRFWRTLGEELGRDLHYRQDGMTIVTDEEALIPRLEQRVAVEQSLGLDIRMVYGKDLAELFPGCRRACLPAATARSMDTPTPCGASTPWRPRPGGRGPQRGMGCPAEALLLERGRVSVSRPRTGICPARGWSWPPAPGAGPLRPRRGSFSPSSRSRCR